MSQLELIKLLKDNVNMNILIYFRGVWKTLSKIYVKISS